MSAISEYLNDERYEPELYDSDGWKLLDQARAELAQLRADLQAAQERIDQQARQLEAAREIIEACASLDRYISDAGIDDARAWIAANPAPKEQP